MVETKRHGDAFDYYYSLGNDRSCQQVGIKFTVSRNSVQKWKQAFNWDERVIQRDLEINKKVEEKTTNAIVNTKADYRADIRSMLQPAKAAVNTVIVEGKDGKPTVNLKVDNPKDFALVIGAIEKLVKLDLLLMGEADSRAETNINFITPDNMTEDDI